MKLRDREKSDWWNEISEEEKESIEKGIEDANSGKVKSYSEVKRFMKSGYKVHWTDHAFSELESTILHLEKNWTEKELENFR